MKIDFASISRRLNEEKIVDPCEIFRSLPGNEDKHDYLRDVQASVLNKWFEEDTRNCKPIPDHAT